MIPLSKLSTHKISRSEFNRAVSSLELNPTQVERARRVLINGESIKSVAADEGLTYESVRVVVSRILNHIDAPKTVFSAEQLDYSLSRMPRLSERSKSMLKRVLVDGETIEAVANSEGISKATLFPKVKRAKALILPEGWKFVSGSLPAEEAAIVEKMFQDALEKFIR